MNGLRAEKARWSKEKTKMSDMIMSALNITFCYLKQHYTAKDLQKIKNEVLLLTSIKECESEEKKTIDITTYQELQEVLSTLNEKESIRKSKGVYYTPTDVVGYILNTSIKSLYGVLNKDNVKDMDLTRVPYRSFCLSKSVFDPTCGAGEFLLAALETKFVLYESKGKNASKSTVEKILGTIYGNDVNEDSITIAKIRLFLCALERYGVSKIIGLSGTINKNFTQKDFVSKLPSKKMAFDIIIGNPPYVEDSKSDLSLKEKYGNIYANVLSNAKGLLSDGGVIGFVIPLSYVATPRMDKIRNELIEELPEQYILSYADRPDCLFSSVHQKLCILIGKKRKSERQVYTGNYQYWYKEERPELFSSTSVVKNNFTQNQYIPKLGNDIDVSVYRKIRLKKNRVSLYDYPQCGDETVFLNMRAAFWIKAFRNEHLGSEYKKFSFDSAGSADYYFCILNSSLFWWYWICVSDCWHITRKELQGFTIPKIRNYTEVTELARRLEENLEQTKEYVGTVQTDYEYKHKNCVDVIHEIDAYINNLFGLTEEENLYIQKFAYRYRISGGADNECN